MATISRSGITWTYTGGTSSGTFCNGDPWIHAPSGITISAITPSGVSGRNGSMINPSNGGVQGYDDRTTQSNNTYDTGENIALSLPYAVSAGSSVCSTISVVSASGDDSYTDELQILTVLSSAPAANSFRPPYLGTDKTIIANKSDLDYTKLGSYAQPNSGTNTPTLSTTEGYFENPWYEQRFNWAGRYHHPSPTNFPLGNYGREMSVASGRACLTLQLDYSDAEKETLLIGVVQAAIDIYGAAKYVSGVWYADGGHNIGRKGLLVLGGVVLDHADMLLYANKSPTATFQEDQTHFIISQEDVNITNDFVAAKLSAATFTTSTKNLNQTGKFSSYSFASGDQIYITGGTGVTTGLYEVASRTDNDNIVLVSDIGGTNPSDVTSSIGWYYNASASHIAYQSGDIGTAEWGIRHQNESFRDDAYWGAAYREINGGSGVTHSTVSIMMGTEAEWNDSPFFSYHERYYGIEAINASNSTNKINLFTYDMREAYVIISSSPPVQMAAMTIGTSLVSTFSAYPETDPGADLCGSGTKPCGGRCIDASKSCTNKVTLDPARWAQGVIPTNTYFGEHGSSDGVSAVTASTEITLTYTAPTTRVDATSFSYPADLRYFEIRIDEGKIVRSDALTRKIVVVTGVSVDLEVRAVGKDGIAGAWSTIQAVTP